MEYGKGVRGVGDEDHGKTGHPTLADARDPTNVLLHVNLPKATYTDMRACHQVTFRLFINHNFSETKY